MAKLSIEQVARDDGRYDPRAVKFVFEGLGHTIEKLRLDEDADQPRHVSGQELAWGLADLARKRWGRLAAMVLNHWGVRRTRDWGDIVYLMIEHEWMSSQENDRIEDFDDVYDFASVFEKNYVIDIK
ncbi:Minf_1886 family protein [Anaerohalosphaeraceae bacterium U12dextr]